MKYLLIAICFFIAIMLSVRLFNFYNAWLAIACFVGIGIVAYYTIKTIIKNNK